MVKKSLTDDMTVRDIAADFDIRATLIKDAARPLGCNSSVRDMHDRCMAKCVYKLMTHGP